MAALVDNDAHISMSESDPYSIDTKPHGHGDVHTLLGSSGLAAAWAAEGRKYIVFFQVREWAQVAAPCCVCKCVI